MPAPVPIAEELKKHFHSICKKLGVKSALELLDRFPVTPPLEAHNAFNALVLLVNAHDNYAEPRFLLGLCYLKGYIIPQSTPLALVSLRNATLLNYKPACSLMAALHEQGDKNVHIDKEPENAAIYRKKYEELCKAEEDATSLRSYPNSASSLIRAASAMPIAVKETLL